MTLSKDLEKRFLDVRNPIKLIDDNTIKRFAAGENVPQGQLVAEEFRPAAYDFQPKAGVIRLKGGRYKQTKTITGLTSVTYQGENPNTSIVDFSSTSANLSFAGTGVYTTGTISGIASTVIVTGSGTSWLANVTTDHQLFIGTRWYRISSVDSNTQITLAEPFVDSSISFATTYRAAIPVTNIIIENIKFLGSTGTAVSFTDCRNIQITSAYFQSSNVGLSFTNCAEIQMDQCFMVGNTSHGLQFTNVGIFNGFSCGALFNGGAGIYGDNLFVGELSGSITEANTGDGVYLTGCSQFNFSVASKANGSQGIEIAASSNDISVFNSIISGNTSDGIKLTATTDRTRINNCLLSGNGAYGVNIAAATCDDTLITSNQFRTNATAAANDSGTTTKIKSNIGLADN